MFDRDLAPLITAITSIICTISVAESGITGTKFRLASYYSSHMVLQRAPAAAVVWGFAPFGDTVTLTLSLTNKTFTAPVNRKDPLTGEGVWSVVLDPLPGFSTTSITAALVSKSQRCITLDDVIFGDVWICSGQSNMAFQLSQVYNASEQFASAHHYPNIRVIAVTKSSSKIPRNDLKSVDETWQRSSTKSLGRRSKKYFSAVCWLYAKYIYKYVNTPLGMIQSTWGGTPIRAWSPPLVNKRCGEPHNTSTEHKTRNFERAPQANDKLDGPKSGSVLWNAMIRPLRNMTIFGVIWYQGEADRKSPQRYHCTFPAMIDAWREEFSQSSHQTDPLFPFGFVQLGPSGNDTTYIGGMPVIRYAQTANYGYVPNKLQTNVFMSIAMDLRDDESPYGSIHYRDKEDAALRVSYSGRAIAYKDQTVAHRFPFPANITATNSEVVRIDYDLIPGDYLSVDEWKGGFEGECSDGEWTRMNVGAIIYCCKLFLRPATPCKSGDAPMRRLRYLWRQTPCKFRACPVYSKINNLPAAPFLLNIANKSMINLEMEAISTT